MQTILIVEDDPAIGRVMELELKHEGYNTLLASDGRKGLKLAEESNCDLIILDLMLPQLNGLELCRRLRSGSSPGKSCPVIMLTARDTVMDKVAGLDQGADDYMVKPFEIEELLARIRVQIRHKALESIDEEYIIFENLKLNKLTRQFWKNDIEIELTKTEFDLMQYFMINQSIVLSKDILLEKVWRMTYWEDTNLVEVYIRYLRNKIETEDGKKYIKTIRGVGYVLRTE